MDQEEAVVKRATILQVDTATITIRGKTFRFMSPQAAAERARANQHCGKAD